MNDDLLELAAASAAEGTNVARRRAVSTAYYAAFHAVCRLVADSIVGDPGLDVDLYEGVYRSVEHRFSDHPARFAVSDETEGIRIALQELRERRADADYRPELYRVSPDYVLNTLGLAQDVMGRLAALDRETSRKLAISLVIDTKQKSKRRLSAEPRILT